MEPIDVAPEFSEFLKSLIDKDVEFLVIGGYAVAVHGYVRSTGDLDVWVNDSPANIQAVREALAMFGLTGALTQPDLLTPGKILRIGMPPLRIEVLTSIDGVTFSECIGRATSAQFGDVAVPVISRDDLLANKRASGRQKDLVDVAELS